MTKMAGIKKSKWEAVVNGRRALNGVPYSATLNGSVAPASDASTLYGIMRDIVSFIEEQNTEMELPDSIQVCIHPPK